MPEEVRLSLQCQVDLLQIELELVRKLYDNLKNHTLESIKELATAIDELRQS